MNGIQKVIKYCAMAFAIVLSVAILGSIVMAVAGVTTGVFGVNTVVGENKERMNLSEEYTVEEAKELGIAKILVDCNAEIILEQGDTLAIEAYNVTEDYEIKCAGDTLRIVEDDSDFSIHWFWLPDATKREKVVVTVPEELTYEQVKVLSGSGAVSVNGIDADNVILDSGSGRVTVAQVNASYFWVDSGSGKVTVSDTIASETKFVTGSGAVAVNDSELGELMLDSGSGAVSLNRIVAEEAEVDTGSGAVSVTGTLTGTCEFETGSGSLAIRLDGQEEEYRVKAECGSGTFRINGKKMDDGSYGNNVKGELIIDSGSGSVNVEFNTPEVE
ncbi:MAG: DUF4097 family beta strand repeat protein [Lachnospiraceae bacterium]|nr:DUF4097 family beta strand repeat protein [Lachnospiraceae bacterium]